jgi:hypothetical protein
VSVYRWLLASGLGLSVIVWSYPRFCTAQPPEVAPARDAAIAETAGGLTLTELIPGNTQALLRIVDLPRFTERLEATRLGQLAKDPRLQPFWEDQLVEIEARLADAGWKLNLRPADVDAIGSGQAALAWIARPQVRLKPYAVLLIVENAERLDETALLLGRIDAELIENKATKRMLEQSGIEITHYELPRASGELVLQEAFYAQIDGHLVASDDLGVLQELITDRFAPGQQRPLAGDPHYQRARSKLPELAENDHDLEYFVRPLGFARILRAIGKQPSRRETDIIQVLEDQGFTTIRAACGRVRLRSDDFDFDHHGYVLADSPLPVSVQILDFPNETGTDVPGWVSPQASTVVAVNWNAQDAFWKIEGVVDGVLGEGLFDSIIQGIKEDPDQPLDIATDVLPFVTGQLLVSSDCVDEPVTPNSRRTLVAVKLIGGDKIASVIDRFMDKDPNASLLQKWGKTNVWQVIHDDGDQELADLGLEDFGDEFLGGDANQDPEETPWLDQWAIAVHGDYLLFASHADMILEALDRFEQPAEQGALLNDPGFSEARSVLLQAIGDEPVCSWQVTLPERSMRMQYELFRQDQLPQSRSMLASVLDRLLRPRDEVRDEVQRVKGAKLPGFEEIKPFLRPRIGLVRTHDDGWQFQSYLLR